MQLDRPVEDINIAQDLQGVSSTGAPLADFSRAQERLLARGDDLRTCDLENTGDIQG